MQGDSSVQEVFHPSHDGARHRLALGPTGYLPGIVQYSAVK